MALSLLIIQQSAVLFIMVLFGFVLAKAKVVHENECGVLSRVTVALRLLVCPVITICVLALLHRLVSIPNSWEILFVIMLGAAGPSGVVVTQLSQIYRVEIDRSSCINVLTTALCALTFPLMTLIAQIIM